MKICKYGITLSRLREEDLEMVRQKRNSEEVNRYMEFREEITPEMQQKWFESINNFENFYYIISWQGRKIGLLNDKNMDWKAHTSESGLFLWEEEFKDTIVPVLASLCLLDVGFYYLDWNTSYIRVLRDNAKAIAYVNSLGYMLTDGQENVENQLYYLTRELLETRGRKIRKAARAFMDESGEGYVFLESFDYESGLALQIENYFTENRIYLHRKGTGGGRMYFRESVK
jgi:UDP-4-amino-4,6-dideoxy-N-acetyl-beta-L-altrosamine N-acetyltransferase